MKQALYLQATTAELHTVLIIWKTFVVLVYLIQTCQISMTKQVFLSLTFLKLFSFAISGLSGPIFRPDKNFCSF